MNLIHRHIFANVVLTCGAAVGLFTFILMIGNAVKDLLGPLLAGKFPLATSVRLLALLPPFVISYALPMGMLMGILLVLGRMSSDREITALRSSGLSVAWLSAPILFTAILGVVLCLLINFRFMPLARVLYHQELAEALRANPVSFIVPKTFIRDFPGKVVYVGEMKGSQLRDIWVWELDKEKRVVRFHRAATGTLAYDAKKNELRLQANDSFSEQRDRKNPEDYKGSYSPGQGERTPFVLPLDDLTVKKSVEVKTKWLTFDQLLTEWRRLGVPNPAVPTAEREMQRMRIQVVIQEKFAMAFSVLSLSLIAIPLGIKVSRKETSANLGLALALAMAYYFATIVVGFVDNHPAFRPDLLMWVPNLAFQGLGFWLYYNIDHS